MKIEGFAVYVFISEMFAMMMFALYFWYKWITWREKAVIAMSIARDNRKKLEMIALYVQTEEGIFTFPDGDSVKTI